VALDKVKPLKLESADTGGVENDEFPTSMDPTEDFVECAGLVIDDATHEDESTVIWRTADDMKFKDTNNPGGYTLTQLAAVGDLINLYLENDPPTPGTDYSNTYTGQRVDQEQWKRTSDASLLKQIDYTYTGQKLTTEVRKVFAANGTTILGQLTITYTYTGQLITSIATVRNV